MMAIWKVTVFSVVFGHCLLSVGSQPTLQFSGYTWLARNSSLHQLQLPGPNYWSQDNAYVDKEGNLHLAISRVDGEFYCPEIRLNRSLGFGTYEMTLHSIQKPEILLNVDIFNRPSQGMFWQTCLGIPKKITSVDAKCDT